MIFAGPQVILYIVEGMAVITSTSTPTWQYLSKFVMYIPFGQVVPRYLNT